MNTTKPKVDLGAVRQKFTPIIESSTGLKRNSADPRLNERLDWMPLYLHNHALLKEEVAQTPQNTNGMGIVSFPGAGGNTDIGSSIYGQTPGSGDKPQSLNLAMQIAAKTVGLDLLPVIPIDSGLVMHHYVDAIYGGGKLKGSKTTPYYIQIEMTRSEQNTLSVGTAYALESDVSGSTVSVANKMRYMGRSRMNGNAVFQILGRNLPFGGTDYEVADVFGDTSVTTSIDSITVSSPSPERSANPDFVRAIEDHISGFSGKFSSEDTANIDAFNQNKPYGRDEGESTSSRTLGARYKSQAVRAGTWKAAITFTREQLQDSRQFGQDLGSQGLSWLSNEVTQSLNKHILDHLFERGVKHHKQIFDASGMHFNVNWNVDTSGAVPFNLGYDPEGQYQTINANAPKAKSTTGGETIGTAQQRIMNQILAAGNFVGTRSRYGAADTAVVGPHVASIIQMISQFTPYPMANTVSQKAGALYPLGSVAGVTFYVDPNMDWTDLRVCIFRRGDGNTPGAALFPYIMGDTVEIVPEGTMGYKAEIYSRYALTDIGHNPESNYLTFEIATENEGDMLTI